ncbi:MAG: class I SAM-dependent methyltransferase [Candidatus Pacebacteria bacterium]|nr:class I SAM-dependent methyltransferase [Candidatus Paceibacterota bacterium]PIR63839.1 MAG: hypothetical protein COU64_02615 [Candidatus Pacebacteria bacterium CG10_big_fil_rev_8_21_14_0_10_40_26]PIZ78385.1 MAG: hypothetical protein COY01_06420 [Candidatus Pacebacteria bacterium CG_4_10_14_0_2_um_filter_40_20]PJA68570.1 MAG: hypothetical protein CO156_03625 [Candidatus Pacebacteria bacterium CG_4_9_14_3_um_filter_40_12]PJC41511.1 MAG: hypothetical protein CO041_02220 [Candidatus Pacebacteri
MNDSNYSNYFSTHFNTLHDNSNHEFSLFEKYYRKNYEHILNDQFNARILDIGCGLGHFLHYLEANGFKNYVGIDLSPEIVDVCRKSSYFNGKNVHNASVLQYLKSSKKKFDFIIMNDVIEHIPYDEIIPTIKLIKTKMKRKGILIIKVVNASNPITGSASRYNDFTHTVGFTEESLKQVAKISGFTKVKIVPQDIWVFNPVINFIGIFAQYILNVIFRSLNLLYGRKTATIFTKDIIAIVEND